MKAKVALAAVRGDRTRANWCRPLAFMRRRSGSGRSGCLRARRLFADDRRREVQEQDALVAELYEQIGRLKMELGWLKKKCPTSIEFLREWSNRTTRG